MKKFTFWDAFIGHLRILFENSCDSHKEINFTRNWHSFVTYKAKKIENSSSIQVSSIAERNDEALLKF